jgi:hypothetical protein
MLPLLPILTTIAPWLARQVFGEGGAEIAQSVTQIATQVFGTDDPQAIEQAIASDPSKAFEFKKLALELQDREMQRQHDERMAEIGDKANARGSFANNRGVLALGMVQVVGYIGVVAAVVWGAFEFLTGTATLEGKDPGTVAVVASIISASVTQLGNMAMQPNGFFYGASHEAVSGVKNFAASIAKFGSMK